MIVYEPDEGRWRSGWSWGAGGMDYEKTAEVKRLGVVRLIVSDRLFYAEFVARWREG